MKKDNVIHIKSYEFAVLIIQTYKYLLKEKKEYVLSKQLLRCGTSIGANIEEAIGGQSRKDFYLPIDSALSNVFGVDNNIESRTESNYLLNNEMRIYLSSKSRIDIGGYIKQKYVKDEVIISFNH